MVASHILGQGAWVDHFDDFLALLSSQYVPLAQLILHLPKHFDDRLRFRQVLLIKQIVHCLNDELQVFGAGSRCLKIHDLEGGRLLSQAV